MDSERIEKGDLVDVFWGSPRPLTCALVLYVPVATGDSWQLRSEDGVIVYVQQFERIVLRVKAPVH